MTTVAHTNPTTPDVTLITEAGERQRTDPPNRRPPEGPLDRSSLRVSAALLVLGQAVFLVSGVFHPSHEDANQHQAVFAEYAASSRWVLIHLGQFIGVAVMMAGLLALSQALNIRAGAAGWTVKLAAVSAAVTIALYAVVQAVDGVVLKHAVDAWAHAPESQRAASFADAETVRWFEWGTRSYQQLAQGAALVLFAVVIVWTARLPRSIGILAAVSGLALMAQGYVIGAEGFSANSTSTGLVALAAGLLFVIGLAVHTFRRH